jgi:hypothetical protein
MRKETRTAWALLALCGVLVLQRAAEWDSARPVQPTTLSASRTRELQRILHERAKVKRTLDNELASVLARSSLASTSGGSSSSSSSNSDRGGVEQALSASSTGVTNTLPAASSAGALPAWPGNSVYHPAASADSLALCTAASAVALVPLKNGCRSWREKKPQQSLTCYKCIKAACNMLQAPHTSPNDGRSSGTRTMARQQTGEDRPLRVEARPTPALTTGIPRTAAFRKISQRHMPR